MKLIVWSLVLFVLSGLAAGVSGPTAQSAEPPDLARVLAEAAAYESGLNVAPWRQIERWTAEATANPDRRRTLEEGLVKLLTGTATDEARGLACRQLAIIGTEVSVDALAGLLKTDTTAGIGCFALAAHPSPKVNEVLRTHLSALRGAARVQVINTLGDRRDPEAVRALAGLVHDPDLATAEAAMVALGKIATEPAPGLIATLRRENNPALTGALIEASFRIAERMAATGNRAAAIGIYTEATQPMSPEMARRYGLGLINYPVYARRAALAALIRLDVEQAEQHIKRALAGKDAELRTVAIAGVSELKSSDASTRFAAELPKLKPQEQALMIDALARRGDGAARSAIGAQLTASNDEVRWAAIAALGRMGDASSVPPLAKALAGAAAAEERQAIEQSLGGLGGGEGTDQALLAELKTASLELQGRLIPVIAKRGSRAAVPALMKETDNPAVAKVAYQALVKLAAAEDFVPLVKKLAELEIPEARADAEAAVAQAMAKVDEISRRWATLSEQLSTTRSIEGRLSWLRLLPGAPGAQALEMVTKAAADPNPRVRDTAVRALAEWPNLSAWEALSEVVRQPANESHRILALRALVRLAVDENAQPTVALIDRYRQLLAAAKTNDDRKLILGALGGVAHPEALPLALSWLENPAVRAEAAQAVKKIAAAIQAQHPQAAREALDQL